MERNRRKDERRGNEDKERRQVKRKQEGKDGGVGQEERMRCTG